jgi:hypothetical protein
LPLAGFFILAFNRLAGVDMDSAQSAPESMAVIKMQSNV